MPDTPIIQVVNGPQYIAETTVQTVGARTTADTTVRTAAASGYMDEGSRQDTPATVTANGS